MNVLTCVLFTQHCSLKIVALFKIRETFQFMIPFELIYKTPAWHRVCVSNPVTQEVETGGF